MSSTLLLAFVIVGTSALTVAAVLMIAAALPRKRSATTTPTVGGGDAAFLFEGQALIDSNERGASLLAALTAAGTGHEYSDWQRLIQFLSRDFLDIEASLHAVDADHRVTLSPDAEGDAAGRAALELRVERSGGTLRLTLVDTLAEGSVLTLDRLSYRAMQDELSLLRGLIDAAPFMLWREAEDGQVTWANSAYLHRLAAKSEIMTWPLPNLFPPGELEDVQRLSLADDAAAARTAWFDVNRVAETGGRLAFALPADEAHKAQRVKHEFVQTLTKTFATLPIGLAVFDRTRRLQIFNPALTDLTGLETEFLLSQPGIEGFLNRMRDKRVLPEPRDYRSWSRRLLDIETGAPNGDFDETWSLPTGQTYRVSANPHPDGALAFLIEDITSETHLTRNVRAEMETSQSVLNQIDAAIAVFASNGQLVLTNAAFSRLWTLEGEEALNAVTLPEALANWSEAGNDPHLWRKVGALARPNGATRSPVTGTMALSDGECLTVEARRTSTGALMISFVSPDTEKTAPEHDSEAVHDAQIMRASA